MGKSNIRLFIPPNTPSRIFHLAWLAFFASFQACTTLPKADMLLYNGPIYTAEANSEAEVIVVSKGQIVAVGGQDLLDAYDVSENGKIDLEGNFLMPGFIEGHGHFSGLGTSLQNLNFLASRSWEQIVDAVKEKTKVTPKGQWIIGRGWHQEKWDSLPFLHSGGYPTHQTLSDISPDHPVLLFHASGHALFANKKAMDLSRISPETPDPQGGAILRDAYKAPIGVFEERAMDQITRTYQDYLSTLNQNQKDSIWYDAIELATKECIKKGITSFQDAGSKFDELKKYKKMAEEGKLGLRLWAMARHNSEDLKATIAEHKAIDAGNKFYTCNAIKSEVDGALGAFGAWLLKPYSDKPHLTGQNTTDIYEVRKIAQIAIDNDMQFCVHAIGDRANKVVLDIYEGMASLYPNKKDRRWRIEHAQHLDTADIPRFREGKIIASMQGIHCTSDAPFVEKRLGQERSKYGAYPWRSLLDNQVLIANGTDAPVEDVDPIPSFYASVTRKRLDDGFTFYSEQSMTRLEALQSYTIHNAYAAFQDSYKGSIKVGKVADFVVLTQDLRNCTDEAIPNTKVVMTIIDGKIVYKSKQ